MSWLCKDWSVVSQARPFSTIKEEKREGGKPVVLQARLFIPQHRSFLVISTDEIIESLVCRREWRKYEAEEEGGRPCAHV